MFLLFYQNDVKKWHKIILLLQIIVHRDNDKSD